MESKKIYIWGAGYYADFIYSVIDRKNCAVVGVIDSDSEKQGKEWKYGLPVFAPEVLRKIIFDYIFISPQKYEGIEKQCLDMGIPKEKVIVYWRDREAEGLYQNRADRVIENEKKCAEYRNRYLNAPYEWGMKEVIEIKSAEKLLNCIIEKKCSLCRYGDGEFEIMLHRVRPWFQNVDLELAERLREIVRTKQEGVIIAVADNFRSLEKYEEDAADSIREYIIPNREEIYALLSRECDYYNAYVSRPYIIYKDKNHAKKIFGLFKKIWKDREILLVEGKTARIGVGNDLFQGVKGINRIECPEKNAWGAYEDILEMIKEKAEHDTLVCISLGPTATVLAYDLAVEGYQALDIGQLDNEYEWYIRGAKQRIPIPGKMVAEVDEGRCAKEKAETDVNCEAEYKEQIVAEISL